MRKNILLTIIFTVFAIVINCIGSAAAERISFPLYLDSIMTIFLVFEFNLFAGIVCAVFTNLALSSFSLVLFPFAICHISTVVIVWILKKKFCATRILTGGANV